MKDVKTSVSCCAVWLSSICINGLHSGAQLGPLGKDQGSGSGFGPEPKPLRLGLFCRDLLHHDLESLVTPSSVSALLQPLP